MIYKLYKFYFLNGVHFGQGSLWDGANTLNADTLFSAMCCEAAMSSQSDSIEQLVAYARGGDLLLSDLLPYVGDELFLPKPMITIGRDNEGNSREKKKFKKLTYVPIKDIDTFLKGELNPDEANAKLSSLGKFEMRTMSSMVGTENSKEALPYSVGVYRFRENCGLYLLAGFGCPEAEQLTDSLLDSLQYSGIGGKRSSGFGRFTLTKKDISDDLLNKLTRNSDCYITLCVSMAKDEELADVIKDAGFVLEKRSGFVASTTYSNTPVRKKDFYSFRAGSFFTKRFEGQVVNLNKDGNHPVYRYAIPFFMGV